MVTQDFSRNDGIRIERASAQDLPRVRHLVEAAYSKYIERIGRKPAPMTADYDALAAAGRLYVLKDADGVQGSIVIGREGDAVSVGNLCVAPSAQGRGYGRLLMAHAETQARSLGLSAVVLFTHEQMHENQVLYPRLGFQEVDRRTEAGFARVYYRKTLDAE